MQVSYFSNGENFLPKEKQYIVVDKQKISIFDYEKVYNKEPEVGDIVYLTKSENEITLEKEENKMGVMPIPKLLITMSLPMMISMLIQALYNIVDSMFVAQLSENALTAVSLAFPIQSLMIAIAAGTGVAAPAQAYQLPAALDWGAIAKGYLPIDFVFPGLTAGGLGMLAAPGGTGKSYMLLALAASVPAMD